jgi:dihydrofolate reductase
MNKKLSIIVAVAKNNAIGKDNKLLWHISEDLKRFKKLTTGNTMIMGKNTFYSLPVRPLPNRISIVITDIPDEKIEGCIMAYSIDDAISKCDSEKENFIIGGGSIYRQFLPIADKLYLTKVNKDFDADCFFPEIDLNAWKLLSSEDCAADNANDFSYSYLIYEKIKS